MTAFIPEAHTLLMVEQTVEGGRPAFSAACLAGACATCYVYEVTQVIHVCTCAKYRQHSSKVHLSKTSTDDIAHDDLLHM